MPMLIIQFQVTKASEEEMDIVPQFCDWLCNLFYKDINTVMNKYKIQSRLKYLQTVSWINWRNSDRKLNIDTIMELISTNFIYTKHKNNIFLIQTDDNVLIPNTNTSLTRLIRFINGGDTTYRATNMFTNIINKYNYVQLNTLWKLFVMKEIGGMTNSVIVTKIV